MLGGFPTVLVAMFFSLEGSGPYPRAQTDTAWMEFPRHWTLGCRDDDDDDDGDDDDDDGDDDDGGDDDDVVDLVGGFNHLEKYESQWEGLWRIIPNIYQYMGN